MGNCCSNDTTASPQGGQSEVNMQRDFKNGGVGGGYKLKAQYQGNVGTHGKTQLGLTQRQVR